MDFINLSPYQYTNPYQYPNPYPNPYPYYNQNITSMLYPNYSWEKIMWMGSTMYDKMQKDSLRIQKALRKELGEEPDEDVKPVPVKPVKSVRSSIGSSSTKSVGSSSTAKPVGTSSSASSSSKPETSSKLKSERQVLSAAIAKPVRLRNKPPNLTDEDLELYNKLLDMVKYSQTLLHPLVKKMKGGGSEKSKKSGNYINPSN